MNITCRIRAALAAVLLMITTTHLIASELESTAKIEMLNINQASAEQIADRLYGVGMNKAQKIVSYRLINGEFKAIEQLTEVKGIGPSIVERNRNIIQL